MTTNESPVFFYSKNSNRIYIVTRNEDGTLRIRARRAIKDDGTIAIRANVSEFHDAGKLINTFGGIDGFLARCIDRDTLAKEVETVSAKAVEKKLASAERKQSLEVASAEKFASLDRNDEGRIESTVENLRAVADYHRNHSIEPLPAMTIGYTISVYASGCVGIKLDSPVEIEGEPVSKIAFFARTGELPQYFHAK